MSHIQLIKISKTGHIAKRKATLMDGDRIVFDGPEGFRVKFQHQKPFGKKNFDYEHPLTGHFKDSGHGELYSIYLGGKRTDGPDGGILPPDPIIIGGGGK